jgi:hypothetical protein
MTAQRRPVDLIVPEMVHQNPIHGIIADWRVEETVLSSILVGHFKSMGIFFCEPGHRDIFITTILFQLKYSPQISSVVAKAARDEETKRRSQSPV